MGKGKLHSDRDGKDILRSILGRRKGHTGAPHEPELRTRTADRVCGNCGKVTRGGEGRQVSLVRGGRLLLRHTRSRATHTSIAHSGPFDWQRHGTECNSP